MSVSTRSSFYQPILFNKPHADFLVIAHRGASAYFPENTMPAFEGAVVMGADMIELDVLLTKDRVPVVFHDAKLHNHTDESGLLNDHTLDELKMLDAGSWFDKKFAGVAIPTLEEVLQFAKGNIALNIEIKTEAVSGELRNGVEEKCLNLVRKYGMSDHVLFSSFDYRAVEHLKKLQPDMPVALLYNRSQSNGRTPSQLVSDYGADAFNCSYHQLTRAWLDDVNKHQIPVLIYTVDDPARMKSLVKKKVSGIFTNKPDVLLKVLSPG